jgi:hypothetical protein
MLSNREILVFPVLSTLDSTIMVWRDGKPAAFSPPGGPAEAPQPYHDIQRFLRQDLAITEDALQRFPATSPDEEGDYFEYLTTFGENNKLHAYFVLLKENFEHVESCNFKTVKFKEITNVFDKTFYGTGEIQQCVRLIYESLKSNKHPVDIDNFL